MNLRRYDKTQPDTIQVKVAKVGSVKQLRNDSSNAINDSITSIFGFLARSKWLILTIVHLPDFGKEADFIYVQ